MRQLITAQLGITMPCLLRFIDANQPGKDTLVPKKQEVKLDENLSKVQALWQFNQFTKSLWGRLSKLVCDSDNMELIFFTLSLSSRPRFPLMVLWWPFLQHKALCSVSSDVINYTICLTLIHLTCDILLYLFLHPRCWSHAWPLHAHIKSPITPHSFSNTHTHS